jgi:hypothetical protein
MMLPTPSQAWQQAPPSLHLQVALREEQQDQQQQQDHCQVLAGTQAGGAAERR